MAYGDKFGGYARGNRRKDVRRPVACRILTGRGRLLGTTKDVSLGGFAVDGGVPGLTRGSVVPMHLQAPDGRWVSVQGKVLRNGAGPASGEFAVQFSDLSAQAFSELERIMLAPLRAQA